MATTDTI